MVTAKVCWHLLTATKIRCKVSPMVGTRRPRRREAGERQMTETEAILKALSNGKAVRCSVLFTKVEKLTGRLDLPAFDDARRALVRAGAIRAVNPAGDVIAVAP